MIKWLTVYVASLKSFKNQDTKESWHEVNVLGRSIESII